MDYQRPRRSCRCVRSSLPFSSTLLFLSIVLPASSFAQLTNPATPLTSTPTTLLTTTSRPSSSTPSNPPPSPTVSNSPPPATSTNSNSFNNGIPDHVFNYYFLIVAFVALLFCVCILYIGRRKKRKAALLRSHGQRALARDVEGFRSRFGIGRSGVGNNGIHGVGEREDGLDERGEAPPPYVPGSKPPSLRSTDERRPRTNHEPSVGEDVELRRMSRGANGPPGYHEHVGLDSDNSTAGVTKPNTAVTASERFGSVRRLLSNTGSSSQA